MKLVQKSIMLLMLLICMVVCKKNYKKLNCKNKKQTNSFLWSLKRKPPAYFFGTIHVPYRKVWSHISKSSKRAFEQSERIFFELDLTDPYTVAKLAQCQLLPDGNDLRSVLPEDLYQRIKEHLHYVRNSLTEWVSAEQKNLGIHADILYNTIVGNWQRKRPVWVMVMIKSLTKADIRSRGAPVLDFHLARKALEKRKVVGAVEKVEEQCQPLNQLNISQVLFALNQTLTIQENIRKGLIRIPQSTEDLIKQYNCGDLDMSVFNQMPELTNNSSMNNDNNFGVEMEDLSGLAIDSYFKTELIHKRNERMAKRIDQILNENPNQSSFFALGAGHFLGNDSIIELLRKRGFEIKPVKASEKLNKIKSRKKLNTKKVRKKVKQKQNHQRNRRRRRKTDRNFRTSLKKSKKNSRSKKKIFSLRNKTNTRYRFDIFSLSSSRQKQKKRRTTLHQKHLNEYLSDEEKRYNKWSYTAKNASGNAMGMHYFLISSHNHFKFCLIHAALFLVVKVFTLK